ncbi:hypothetical protein [Pantoea sp. A4]|uniref:hypothetical protein n=1 Tax=Pantoea sp. A4 TaxID=1225184 RepID=UPI0012ED35E8|nr:hypothetical protein [Pantoea sp. A4]
MAEREDRSLLEVEEKYNNFHLPHARFQMARWVLICLFGLICFLIAYRIFPDGSASEDVKTVFNKVFDSVVPIASLILGYYFGSSSQEN